MQLSLFIEFHWTKLKFWHNRMELHWLVMQIILFLNIYIYKSVYKKSVYIYLFTLQFFIYYHYIFLYFIYNWWPLLSKKKSSFW